MIAAAAPSPNLAARRLRNLLAQLDMPRSDVAQLLRELADELDPLSPATVDAELRAAAEHEAAVLRSEGYSVTTSLAIRTLGAARILGRSAGTLRNWRSSGAGPQWRADHGVVHYSLLDLLAWRRGSSRTVTISDADRV